MRDLIALVSNYYVDKNLKEILAFVYYGSIDPKTIDQNIEYHSTMV